MRRYAAGVAAIGLIAGTFMGSGRVSAQDDPATPSLCSLVTPAELQVIYGEPFDEGRGTRGATDNVECVWPKAEGFVSIDWTTGRAGVLDEEERITYDSTFAIPGRDEEAYEASHLERADVWVIHLQSRPVFILHVRASEFNASSHLPQLRAVAQMVIGRAEAQLKALPKIRSTRADPKLTLLYHLSGLRGDVVEVDEQSRDEDGAICYALEDGEPIFDFIFRVVELSTGREVARSQRIIGTTVQPRDWEHVDCVFRAVIKRFPHVDAVRIYASSEAEQDFAYQYFEDLNWRVAVEN